MIAAREHAELAGTEGLIALTCNEIRRLFVRLVIEPGRSLACPLAWSHWRRRINTAPAPATTTVKKTPTHGHNDLRLEH